MRDYETGEGLPEEDNEAYWAMFVAVDPIYFEDAMKSEKWRTTMDVEMEAIKKNWHMGINGIAWGRKEGWGEMGFIRLSLMKMEKWTNTRLGL